MQTKRPHVCHFPAPARCTYETAAGKWASREWQPGEKAEYERTVLNRSDRTAAVPLTYAPAPAST